LVVVIKIVRRRGLKAVRNEVNCAVRLHVETTCRTSSHL
jgi:hypothetical protein